ncbi:transcription elongation factor 1 homolog isoform X1 [Halyomorpha halys]|uniref:transcription elongation factor 1 homolog isoform X1 n=2 Tax=Halyomorpha halys TaxID=286706 RepID=UPI0006D51D20|nr:transcription elongation factor 1 homolog isoform X1 [Halyomorpha halys]
MVYFGILISMGRRKSNRKPPPKRKAIVPLDTQFDCPFCNHEKSCEVTMDRVRSSARIVCRICLEDFQTITNFLSEPIDIYNDWIDACEKAN